MERAGKRVQILSSIAAVLAAIVCAAGASLPASAEISVQKKPGGGLIISGKPSEGIKPVADGQKTPFEKITGDFRITLGDRTGKISRKNTSTLTDGTLLYNFKPDMPYKALTEYYVAIHPATEQVYMIGAEGEMKEMARCRSELRVLGDELGKYGEPVKESNPFHESIGILQEGKIVSARCDNGFMSVKLILQYVDQNLKKEAEKETLRRAKAGL